MRLGGLELQLDLPLQVLVEQDRAPVLLAKLARGRRIRVPKLDRPVRPDPAGRVADVKPFVKRAPGGVTVEQFALLLDVGAEFGGARRPGAVFPQKSREREFQRPQLEGVHALVFHQLRLPQRFQLGLDFRPAEQRPGARRIPEILDRLHIQIDRVLEERRTGQVGAYVERLAVGDGVQGVQADEACLHVVGEPIDDRVQVGEIAAAPVPGGTQSIERDRQAARAPAVTDDRGNPSAVGAEDEAHGRVPAAFREPDLDVVVAAWSGGRERHFLAHEGDAAQVGPAGAGQLGELDRTPLHFPAFPTDH